MQIVAETFIYIYFSEVNELNFLVLSDLYHHINGELEGRDIAPEPFKEVFQFLLEVDPFMKYQCKLDDNDMWPLEKGNYMFDITRLRKEMGIELWEHNTWKSYKPQAERMLSFMHHANSVKFLAYSKNSCLKALTRLLSIHARDVSNLNARKLRKVFLYDLMIFSMPFSDE